MMKNEISEKGVYLNTAEVCAELVENHERLLNLLAHYKQQASFYKESYKLFNQKYNKLASGQSSAEEYDEILEEL